jgi:hypothetical protein
MSRTVHTACDKDRKEPYASGRFIGPDVDLVSLSAGVAVGVCGERIPTGVRFSIGSEPDRDVRLSTCLEYAECIQSL